MNPHTRQWLHGLRGTTAGLHLEAEALREAAAGHGGELADIADNLQALVRRLQEHLHAYPEDPAAERGVKR